MHISLTVTGQAGRPGGGCQMPNAAADTTTKLWNVASCRALAGCLQEASMYVSRRVARVWPCQVVVWAGTPRNCTYPSIGPASQFLDLGSTCT